ncbi:hemagglutinin repeat-containing protein, partial [uncultured Actinobacillus sp.]|uniref:hemagglutinin repeat-containing protein n=1 Tax=uncultured Actinobacillus sp. TaxID=417616 RepID=UPI0025D1C5A5
RIESHESHEYKQSGLTIALSTPVTDAALAAYNTARQLKQTQSSRLQSLYAVKAATEIAQAAQNLEKVSATLSQLEQLDNLNKNAAAAENPAVKVSIGYGASQQKTTTDTYSLTHDKSVLSAGNVLVTATDGKARFNGVDIQAENANINAKLGIESQGVKDTYASHTTSKNSSASFGVFVGFNGDSFGIGLEGGASLGKGKTNIDSETWQNNHWNVKHLETNSEQGGFTLDAATIQADSWTGKLNSLTLQSRQDTEKYTSKNTQASASGSVAYGSGGGASASASYTSAKLDTAQVNEQTGIHLGKGGIDVTVNGHTQLNGAVITSEADAEHNKLTTQTIRATEIKNHSELKTESAAVGTGAMGAMTMAMSALGNQHDTNYSTTKSAIGANIALITEDKNAQNINRNTENTNEKVKKQDLAKAQENQEAAKLVGEIASNLVGIYTFKEREAIEKAKLEVGKLQADAKEKGISQEDLEKSTVYQKAQQNLTALQASYDDNYGIGSTKGRAIQAVTAALQGIAGGSIEQAAVGLASPYLNEQIKQWTTDKDGNVDKTANLAAHAILGALEAQVTGNNALAGAAAATTGEAAAMVITNTLYNGKKAEELTENEKQNVVFLSQVASGLASTFIANDGTASAAMGSEIGKRAVENNYLSKQDWQNYQSEIRQCGGDRSCVIAVNDKYEKIDQENSKAIEAACKLGGNSESCKARADLAYEGSTYGAKYVYTSNYTGWDNAWLSNRIESSYSDSQLTPSVALLGDETLAKLTALAKDKEFVASLENDKSKQEQFRALVDQSVVAIRTENGAAYEFSGRNLSSPLSELEKITGRYDIYNKETPLEPVIFEDLLVGGGFKLTTEGLSFTTKKLTSAGEKWVSGMATDEMLTLGVAAEIHFSKALEKLLTSSSAAVGNVFKAASDAPMKTTVANIGAAGSVITTNEAYKYIRSDNPLPLTKENLINSSYDIGVEISKAALWGNMPWYMGIAGNIATDSVAYGKPNVADNISYGISGEAIDRVLPNVPNATYIREASLGLIKYIQPKVENSSNDK